MKTNLIFKILIVLITIIVSLSFFCNVQAAEHIETKESIKQDEDFTLPEGTLMKYDAKTGETSQVDMEELKQVISTLNNNSKIPFNVLPAKIPQNSHFNLLSPQALNESYDRVQYPTNWPSRAVCKVTFYDDYEKDTGLASAVIVGKNIALTAAHTIYDKNRTINRDWDCAPAYNNGYYSNQYYSNIHCGWSQVYYYNEWFNDYNANYDIAVAVLNENLGDQIGGSLGAVSYGTNNELLNLDYSCYGYPLIYSLNNNPEQYVSKGQIIDPKNTHFYLNSPTVDGFSGGPVLRDTDNYVIGILAGRDIDHDNESVAIRISQSIIDLIRQLREE